MIFGQKIRHRTYQSVSLSNAFLVAHADCEPLQRIGFLGHFLNEIGNSTSTKPSWVPAWKVFTSLETVSTDCLQQTAAWRVQNQRFTPAVRWWRGVAVADYMGWLLATWCRENVQYKVQT